MKLDRAEILSVIALQADELANRAKGIIRGISGQPVFARDLAASVARIGELISYFEEVPHHADSRRDLGKKLG